MITKFLDSFLEFGASELEMPALLDSRALIDLYGEDLKSRAFLTTDQIDGEKILRPDFTVPIAQLHIGSGALSAKYSYAGPGWRSQPYGSDRPKEYYQVGVEYFHQGWSASADAESFNLFQKVVRKVKLDLEVGDIGILRSLVLDLDISDNIVNAKVRS